jgi:hypothetical protein
MHFANTNFQSLRHARYLETTMTDADKRQKLNRQKPNVQINNVDTIRNSNNKRPLLYDLVYPYEPSQECESSVNISSYESVSGAFLQLCGYH